MLAPLAIAGTAQAAIAGANPGTTPDRPDLVSAHVLSTSEVQVCFDKPVSSVQGGDFYLTGYDAGNYKADTGSTAVDASNGSCVDAMYDSATIGDITQYTAVDVMGGAVTYASTGLSNHADSTTLAESSTHNGTTGLTTAPNLQSILAPTSTEVSNNQLVFQFDKSVQIPNTSAPDFEIYNTSATSCYSTGESIVPNTNGQDVLAQFDPSCMSVTSAIQGDVQDDYEVSGAQVKASSDTNAISAQQSKPVPNGPNSGHPVYAPYLVSAQLDPNNTDGIIYTFNEPVQTTGQNDLCFVLATGFNSLTCSNTAGGTVSQVSPTTVEATFGGALSTQQEYAVQATAYYGAVAALDNGEPPNYDDSTNIGDNQNAFARGFTTGPDVTGIQMQSNGNALATLDQRLCVTGSNGMSSAAVCNQAPVEVGDINIYQGAGADTPTHPSGYVVNSPDQKAGPQSLTLLATSGKFVQFIGYESAGDNGALEGTLSANGNTSYNNDGDPYNIDQIVQPIGTAAIAKATHAIRVEIKRARRHHLRFRRRGDRAHWARTRH